MTVAPRRTLLALGGVVVALVATTGCAAHWAYRQAEDAVARGEWDLAVARYTKAIEKDPKNIGYKIALENARIQASRFHYDKAREALAASDLEKAAEELEIASNYDPANRSAADDLKLVRDRIRKREEEQRERAEFEQTKARAQATARTPLPVLSPRSPVPITMRFEDVSICELILLRQMPLQSNGTHPIPRLDRDALILHRIYERFVANFYRIHSKAGQ